MVRFSSMTYKWSVYSVPRADHILCSSTHWYRWYYWYRSLCPDWQGLVERWAGITIPGFFHMVNIGSTGHMC